MKYWTAVGLFTIFPLTDIVATYSSLFKVKSRLKREIEARHLELKQNTRRVRSRDLNSHCFMNMFYVHAGYQSPRAYTFV